MAASILGNTPAAALGGEIPALVRQTALGLRLRLARQRGEAGERNIGNHAGHKLGERALLHISFDYRNLKFRL
jgi:hypothetical protein